MLKNKNILIISPHPDDDAICSGGLIMLGKKEKANIFVLYIAVGTSRQFLTGKTTANERIPEVKNAANYGRYKYTIAFQGDEFMRLDSLPQKNIIEVIEDTAQKFKPDIVTLPFRHSFDQDHRAVASAAITTFRPLPKDLRHQPKMILECEEPYSWSNDSPFVPNFYFDISEVMDEKLKLLQYHTTQIRQDPFPRSPDNLRRLAGMRGCEMGTKYAESYNILKGQLL